MNSNDMVTRLEKLGVKFELTEFPGNLFTAQAVADTLKMRLAQVAKAMLFKVGDACGVAVVPGDRRVSLSALSQLHKGRRAALVRREHVERATGLRVGAVTPLVRLLREDIAVFIDSGVMQEPMINISTGDLKTGLSLAPGDLARAVNATIGSIAE